MEPNWSEEVPHAGDSAADRALAELTSAYRVSFAKTGDPTGGGRPTWPRHAPTVDRVLQFKNDGVIAGLDPLKARLDLWQKVWESTP